MRSESHGLRLSRCVVQNAGSDNPAGKKLCGDCGAPLANRCLKCGADNPPAKRGSARPCSPPRTPSHTHKRPPGACLRFRSRQEQTDPSSISNERKTVTMLFADIKGSTELMEDLDPEEARAIIEPALKLMIDARRHYAVYVVQSS